MKGRKELLVGSVVLLGIVTAVVGTLWLQGRRFGSTETEVHVLMRDVGQLSIGNTVTFRGGSIGRVGDIIVEDNGAAPASMVADWQAEIITRSQCPQYDYS